MIETRTVAARRTLHFHTLDDVAADAERLAASPDTKMLGNWTLSHLLMHLAKAIDSSIDGIAVRAPWYVRLVARPIKRRILTKGMRPGFKLPKEVEHTFFPDAESPPAALAELRRAIVRTRSEPMTARHPILGQLSPGEWTQLHLRHAELHLSFAVPGADGAPRANQPER